MVADGAPKDNDIKAVVLLQEAFRQLKAFGGWGDGAEVLAAAGIDPGAPGVLTGKKANAAGRRPRRRARHAPGLGPHPAGPRVDGAADGLSARPGSPVPCFRGTGDPAASVSRPGTAAAATGRRGRGSRSAPRSPGWSRSISVIRLIHLALFQK